MILNLDGERTVVAGRTGSGKSVLGAHLLAHNSRQSWVILDPKATGAYKNLPDARIVRGLELKPILRSLEKTRYTIIRPHVADDAEKQDEFVKQLHGCVRNVGLCIDELYSIHKNGKAGVGLTAWMTRGRELKQSFLGLTQRPRWVSRFVFSESTFACAMDLALAEDRKALRDSTGCDDFSERVRDHQVLVYDVGKDRATLCSPVEFRG